MNLSPRYAALAGALSGELSCKDQHAQYAGERDRVAALIAKLGADAVSCNKQRADYQSAVQARLAAEQRGVACREAFAVWTKAKAEQDAGLAQAKKCQTYLAAKAEWQAYVDRTNAQNAAAKASYDKLYAETDARNKAISQQNVAMAADHARTLAMWQQKDTAYKNYLSAVNAQAYNMSMQWSATQQKFPKETSYQFNHRQSRCNTHMICMTAADKQKYAAQCTVVKGLGLGYAGLGALPVADLCRTRQYYPTCPETCPTSVAAPGTAPAKPAIIPFVAYPNPLSYPAPAPLEDFLRSKGVERMPDDCGSWRVQVPGTKPACDPNATLPNVPQAPTCTIPNAPAMPAAPTCIIQADAPPVQAPQVVVPAQVEPAAVIPTSKPGLLAQVSPMWLILAAGAGGLYWYSKKK